MSSVLRGIVLAHGQVAEALVGAVEEITGVSGALVPVSNAGCDLGVLEDRIRAAVAGGEALVFVDLPNGSCFVAAMHALGQLPGVRVVTGVNLTMLLDFVFHRTDPIDDAAARAGRMGVRAIAGT